MRRLPAAYGLALIRIGVGAYFLATASEKLGRGWLRDGQLLTRMLRNALPRAAPWYASYLRHPVLPHAGLFAQLVVLAERPAGFRRSRPGDPGWRAGRYPAQPQLHGDEGVREYLRLGRPAVRSLRARAAPDVCRTRPGARRRRLAPAPPARRRSAPLATAPPLRD